MIEKMAESFSLSEDVAMEPRRPETEAAIKAVEHALEMAREGSGRIHAKEGRDVVTDTDLAIEDMIRANLTPAFGIPVIGEERGGEVPGSEPHWLVDPICGTRNYASGIPLYSVNVALVEQGAVSISVVGDGSTGAIYEAERERGAWSVGDIPKRLFTSDASQTVDFEAWPRPGANRDRAALLAAAAIQANHWDIRFLSTTLSLAYVASGRLSACILFAAPAQVHVAAGTLLVAEAGGTVSDLDDRPWSLGSHSLVCSATEELHRDLLELVSAGR
jgi:myo-inositol-1(or 4)-monophosphatase